MRVHELAKEIDKPSKEVLTFLQEKGIEVKAAQSSVEDSAADMVRKAFGKKGEPQLTEEKKTTAPEVTAQEVKKEEAEA